MIIHQKFIKLFYYRKLVIWMGGCIANHQKKIRLHHKLNTKLQKSPLKHDDHQLGDASSHQASCGRFQEKGNKVFLSQTCAETALEKGQGNTQSIISSEEFIQKTIQRNGSQKETLTNDNSTQQKEQYSQKKDQVEDDEDYDLRGTVINSRQFSRQMQDAIVQADQMGQLPDSSPCEDRKWRRKIVGLSVISEVSNSREASEINSKLTSIKLSTISSYSKSNQI